MIIHREKNAPMTKKSLMFDLKHKLAETFFIRQQKETRNKKKNFLIFFLSGGDWKACQETFPFLWMTVAALSRNRPIRPIRRLGFFLLK